MKHNVKQTTTKKTNDQIQLIKKPKTKKCILKITKTVKNCDHGHIFRDLSAKHKHNQLYDFETLTLHART